MLKSKKNKKGFTLLEILVVVALFAVLSVLISNVYLLSLKAQRQTSSRQKALSNVRYVIETIVRQARTSEIDYAFYDVDDNPQLIDQPTDMLALLDQEGHSYIFREDNNQVEMVVDLQPYALTTSAEILVTNLSFYINPASSPFRDERCRFKDSVVPGVGCAVLNACTIDDPNPRAYSSGFCQCRVGFDEQDCRITRHCDSSAVDDPNFGLCLPPNQQPQVTIVVGFKTQGVKIEEQKFIFLQTTVSSRFYKR